MACIFYNRKYAENRSSAVYCNSKTEDRAHREIPTCLSTLRDIPFYIYPVTENSFREILVVDRL